MMPASFRRLLKAAQAVGMPIEAWGENAVLVGAKRGRGGRLLRGVVLWPTGWAQDATTDLSAARMFRAKDAAELLGLGKEDVKQ